MTSKERRKLTFLNPNPIFILDLSTVVEMIIEQDVEQPQGILIPRLSCCVASFQFDQSCMTRLLSALTMEVHEGTYIFLGLVVDDPIDEWEFVCTSFFSPFNLF